LFLKKNIEKYLVYYIISFNGKKIKKGTLMTRYATYQMSIAFLLLTILLFCCSDSEHRTGMLGQTSTVIINLGLPDDLAMVNPSIIDRIRRFFTKDAIAQTAPAAFSSVKVRVTATDIGIIEKEFNPYGTISLSVPAGNLRQFEVIAYVAPGDPSAAISFRGTSIADVEAGKTVTVPVAMTLNETKIVVADWFFDQIVQIDSFLNGDITWKVNNLGLSTFFNPYEIDFDSRGRIYIARSTTPNPLVRIDNINSSTYDIISTSEFGIKAIAIDRKNNLIYYVQTNNEFYRCTTNGDAVTGPLSRTGVATIQTFYGIAYDDIENVLFISGLNVSAQSAIFKYSINSNTIISSNNSSVFNLPSHVLVKHPYLYVANTNGTDGNRVIQLTKNLAIVKGYGNFASTAGVENTARGMFYGPTRFVAILNRRITLVDEDDDNFGRRDKLITMDDIDGNGWDTYGRYSAVAGTGYFQFYYGS